MEYAAWKSHYKDIIEDFGFSREADWEASDLLNDLVRTASDEGRIDPVDETVELLRGLLKDKAIYVFGGGSNLERETEKITEMGMFEEEVEEKIYNPAADFTFTIKRKRRKSVRIACDGATGRVMGTGLVPEVVVTDLDGEVESQLEAMKEGAVMVLHGHGDNMDKLRKWVPRISGKLVPTCQCRPHSRVRNFGGFTDGDRAVYLAEAMGANSAVLVGFDFTRAAGQKNSDPEIKMKKLAWASLLIASLEDIRVVHFGGLPL